MTSAAQSTGAVVPPTHDRSMAERFLAALDPATKRFTFQFFSDRGRGFAEIVHCTIDELWPRALELNTAVRGIGVFVTINTTDFKGRRTKNIVCPRALFVDADGADQVRGCTQILEQSRVAPSMIVETSANSAHFYWLCDDVLSERFSTYQRALINRLGTDAAVQDLTRVMRLPGTLHLKGPSPHLVRLILHEPRRTVKSAELLMQLGASLTASSAQAPQRTVSGFPDADPERSRWLFGDYYMASAGELTAGLETNIEEIRSAVSAIPPSAISSEPEWMKVARGLAHEPAIYEDQADQLWEILDTASRAAPSYNEIDNRERWIRYRDEAFNTDTPITIATVFHMARRYGWPGWSPPVTPAGYHGAGLGLVTLPTTGLEVKFSNIPHRRWLYGVDASRGEISLFASPGGVGKSSAAIGMSISVVTNRPLLKEKIWGGVAHKALYVNAEDSRTEMRRRIWAFCLKHGVAEHDLGGLLVAGADDWRVQRLSLLRTEKGTSLLDEVGIAHLETLLSDLRPDLLVLDPLIALCGGGNVNDNAAMSLVMRALKRLAVKFDCAVLVIHHTWKGGDLSNA